MTKKYLIKISLLSVFVALAIYIWNSNAGRFSNLHIWFILPYYVLFTLAIHYWVLKNPDPKKFIMRFLGVTGIKLFINLIIILVYGLNLKSSAISFALGFLLIYFVFTFFECIQLLQPLKEKNESKSL